MMVFIVIILCCDEFCISLPIMRKGNALRRMMCYTLYIIVAISCHGQDYTYGTRFTLSARHFVDSIPIEFEDGQIYVRAAAGGQAYRFCIDTGSSQGIVYADGRFPWVRKLGKITSHDANGTASKIDVVEYPDFRIGHLTIHGYTGSLLNSHIDHTDYDAVLGFDLVNKGLAIKIDVEHGVMVVTDDTRYFDGECGFAVKYRLPRWVPVIKVTPYSGCTDEARFDTGSRRLYVMSAESCRKFYARYADFGSQIEGWGHGSRAIGSFGAEKASDVAFLWLDELQWGGFSFCDYHTMTTQGASRIGCEIFHYGSVVMNPRRKELIFQPRDSANTCLVSNEQMDIAFIPVKGRATVGMIWEGSPHFRNGFRQGDQIISIDGQGISSFAQFLAYPFINGHLHRFTVLGTDGIIRQVESER